MLRRLANRYPLGSFYVLAVLIAMAVMVAFFAWSAINPAVAGVLGGYFVFLESRNTYGNALAIFQYMVSGQPSMVLVLVFAAAPSIAAIVVCLARNGGAGLKSLLTRLRPWSREVGWQRGVRVYLVFLLAYGAICAAYLWLNQAAAGPFAFEKVYSTLGAAPFAVLATLLLGLLIDEGGLLEELGWRGYALPLLLGRMASPLRASIVLGLLWWAWHLPREITTLLGPFETGVYLWNQFVFLVLCVALSIIITWMFNLTGGSVWAGILIHGGTNVWSKGLGGPLYGALGFDLRTVIVVLVAIALVVATRGKLGLARLPRQ